MMTEKTMYKDHYVAQTYMKHFQNQSKPGFICVYWKKNGRYKEDIPINTICYERDWSSVVSGDEKVRAVEEYLKVFEPKWNSCVSALQQKELSLETKYFMAGYMAFLRTFTPAAVRVNQEGISEIFQSVFDDIGSRILEENPEKYREVREIMKEKSPVRVVAKEEFVKNSLARQLADLQAKLHLYPWKILSNETDMPFLASDNPLCMETFGPDSAMFYLPITPRIAVLVKTFRLTDDQLKQKKGFDSEFCGIKSFGVNRLNKLLVSRSENMVLSSGYSFRIKRLVDKYKNKMAGMVTSKIGPYIINQDRVVVRESHLTKE